MCLYKEYGLNWDAHTLVSTKIEPSFVTRWFRLYPTAYQAWRSMRMEILGYPQGVFYQTDFLFVGNDDHR